MLDVTTLLFVTVFVLALCGLLLLFAWLQNREVGALAWWGTTFLLFASATALFGQRGVIAEVWSNQISNALVMLACGLMWTGARVFEHRKPLPLPLLAGAAVWLVACRFDAFLHSGPARVVLASCIVGTYSALLIREFWLNRHDGLVSRWPIMALVALHAVLFPIRAPLALSLPLPFGSAPGSFWSTILIFAPMFYALTLVFLLTALTKERAELHHRQAATIDPLTGIPNRRGFYERAERVVARSQLERIPLTLLLFDLDNFKNINDRFGHRTGDNVLLLFSHCAKETLRPLDLIGRMGGDEFVALLPDVTPDSALGVAERVRDAFASAAQEVDGYPVAGTVSIGIAVTTQTGFDFDALYAAADAALYRAKHRGRNRIEAGRTMQDSAPQRGEGLTAATAGS